MGKDIRPHLDSFLCDNSDKSAEQLEELAWRFTASDPDSGLSLALLMMAHFETVDALLLAAVSRRTWQLGGALLPDPAETDSEEYGNLSSMLAENLANAVRGDPRRILTGADRIFFEGLPDSFTIYRGCAGLSTDQAARGICWTTRRDVAEWFALRAAENEKVDPILLCATITKTEVRLASAHECAVIATPSNSRVLKCRHQALSELPSPGTWDGVPMSSMH